MASLEWNLEKDYKFKILSNLFLFYLQTILWVPPESIPVTLLVRSQADLNHPLTNGISSTLVVKF